MLGLQSGVIDGPMGELARAILIDTLTQKCAKFLFADLISREQLQSIRQLLQLIPFAEVVLLRYASLSMAYNGLHYRLWNIGLR